jgi:hypothetical protein
MPEAAQTVEHMLEILHQATHLLHVEFDFISSPALLSSLGRTPSGVLTTLKVCVCTEEMVSSLVYIGQLVTLEHLEMKIGKSTQWPHKGRPWSMPSLFRVDIEPGIEQIGEGIPIICSGLMGFLCKCDFPLLTFFVYNLSTHLEAEHAQLRRFLELHPGIADLDILVESWQWTDLVPHIKATDFTPMPLYAQLGPHIPDSVKNLRLCVCNDRDLEPLWGILAYLSEYERNISTVQVYHLDFVFSWMSRQESLGRNLPLSEALLVAGLLRFVIKLKEKNIRLLDIDSMSLDALIGGPGKDGGK